MKKILYIICAFSFLTIIGEVASAMESRELDGRRTPKGCARHELMAKVAEACEDSHFVSICDDEGDNEADEGVEVVSPCAASPLADFLQEKDLLKLGLVQSMPPAVADKYAASIDATVLIHLSNEDRAAFTGKQLYTIWLNTKKKDRELFHRREQVAIRKNTPLFKEVNAFLSRR